MDTLTFQHAEFAELHCRSNFTFLGAGSSPQEMVTQAAALGYQAIAITDECSVAGVVRAWQQAKLETIHLVIGSFFRYQNQKFTILVKNKHGYEQLSALI